MNLKSPIETIDLVTRETELNSDDGDRLLPHKTVVMDLQADSAVPHLPGSSEGGL